LRCGRVAFKRLARNSGAEGVRADRCSAADEDESTGGRDDRRSVGRSFFEFEFDVSRRNLVPAPSGILYQNIENPPSPDSSTGRLAKEPRSSLNLLAQGTSPAVAEGRSIKVDGFGGAGEGRASSPGRAFSFFATVVACL